MSDDGRSDDGWGRACKLDFASAPRTCAHPPHDGAPAELAAQRPQALEQRHACIPPLSRARLAPDAAPRGAAAVPLRPYAARTIARGGKSLQPLSVADGRPAGRQGCGSPH